MGSCVRRFVFGIALAVAGCGVNDRRPSPPCDGTCEDANAMRAVREILKLVYNLTLQSKPVGEQDRSTPCPLGGRARVFGEASSDPMRGATEVALSYELTGCLYLQIDEDADKNYSMALDGVVVQSGVIAVQPSSTSALLMSSDDLSLYGTVYDPPRAYLGEHCELRLTQSGNHLSGTICGREAGLDL